MSDSIKNFDKADDDFYEQPFAFEYGPEEARTIFEKGKEYRKTKTIRAVGPIKRPINVQTQEGKLSAPAGSFVATDGKRVWPIDAEYMKENYEEVPEGDGE